MEVGAERHPQDLITPRKETRHPLYTSLTLSQCRSGLLWKISPPLVLDPRTVQPVASGYTDNSSMTDTANSQFFSDTEY